MDFWHWTGWIECWEMLLGCRVLSIDLISAKVTPNENLSLVPLQYLFISLRTTVPSKICFAFNTSQRRNDISIHRTCCLLKSSIDLSIFVMPNFLSITGVVVVRASGKWHFSCFSSWDVEAARKSAASTSLVIRDANGRKGVIWSAVPVALYFLFIVPAAARRRPGYGLLRPGFSLKR